MINDKDKYLIIQNKLFLSDGIYFLQQSNTGQCSLHNLDFVISQYEDLFKKCEIEISLSYEFKDGELIIHPADQHSKDILEYCKYKGIIM